MPTKSYLELQEKSSNPSRGTKYGERVIDSIKKYKRYFDGKILDVGCNDGLSTEYIQELGYEVTGIDISHERVATARRLGLPVIFAEQENLPFKDKSFGTVFSSHTLEHSWDMEGTLAEYERVADRAIIIFPIESKRKNPAHTSTIKSFDDILKYINGEVLVQEKLRRHEKEGVLVINYATHV